MLLKIRVRGCREQFAHDGIDVRRAIVLAEMMEYLIERWCEVSILENTIKQNSAAGICRGSQLVDQLLREIDKTREPRRL